MAKVTMPQLGESVAEGTIGKWLKQPGDHVAKYEPLLEVITDKVNAEVPSPFEGTLTEILVEEGETVPNNAEIAVIETATMPATARPRPAPAAAADAPRRPAAAPAARGRRRPTARPPSRRTGRRAPTSDRPPSRAAVPMAAAAAATRSADDLPGNPDARMTPAVRRLLREHGLTAAQIVGTGRRRADHPRGRHRPRRGRPDRQAGRRPGAGSPAAAAGRRRSARAAAAARAPRPSAPAPPLARRSTFPPGADEVLVPMTQMRKGITAQMTRALAVPHAYVPMEVDVTNLVRLRESAKRDFQAREGISLSYVPFVVKASRRGAQAPPGLQRPLDRGGPAGQAPGQRRGGRGRRRRAHRAGRSATSTSSRSAASTGRSPTSPPGPGRTSSGSTTSGAARSPSTTPAGSART